MNEPALSSSWKTASIQSGEELAEAFRRFPISGVELEYRLPQQLLADFLKSFAATGLGVVSIHNFFPLPAHIPRTKASGDLFELSHPDKEHRLEAVRLTRRSLEWAHELEAPFLVLHCGKVAMKPSLEQLRSLFEAGRADGEEARALRDQWLQQRRRLLPKHLDALLLSLDRLLPLAERYGVKVGLENRAHFHELPGPGELPQIFAEFAGAPVGYWHDTGHAHVNNVLGFSEHGRGLEQFADHLVGVHCHDARQLDDHLPPGDGEIDFAPVLDALKPGVPCVVELKPGTTEDDVARGIDFLRRAIADHKTATTGPC